jgi:hypothetical protein
VDESHVTLPQVRAMYGGDYARKKTLVEYGFRLPSAFDNRPLKFEEVESKLNQMVFVSATPGEYERRNSTRIAQQVIRPTGLLDPLISVRPVEGQVTGRDQRPHGEERACSCDHPDQEDGRGPDRLLDRAGHQGQIYAPRGGHL